MRVKQYLNNKKSHVYDEDFLTEYHKDQKIDSDMVYTNNKKR